MQKLVATSLASLMFAGTLINPIVAEAQSGTTTPIKHLVVIFQENVSFDHYFGTYPKALNPAGQPRFIAKPGTPAVNGYTDGLLYNNPNALNTVNGTGPANPFRLDRSQAATADQDHDYTAGTAGVSRRLDGLVSQVHRHARSAAQRPDRRMDW